MLALKNCQQLDSVSKGQQKVACSFGINKTHPQCKLSNNVFVLATAIMPLAQGSPQVPHCSSSHTLCFPIALLLKKKLCSQLQQEPAELLAAMQSTELPCGTNTAATPIRKTESQWKPSITSSRSIWVVSALATSGLHEEGLGHGWSLAPHGQLLIRTVPKPTTAQVQTHILIPHIPTGYATFNFSGYFPHFSNFVSYLKKIRKEHD